MFSVADASRGYELPGIQTAAIAHIISTKPRAGKEKIQSYIQVQTSGSAVWFIVSNYFTTLGFHIKYGSSVEKSAEFQPA